ncbi:class I SAM-dependent methyltransferase [Sulfitobacter sp. F26204]|uniref:class I SAM-dependent methyltransferase n=1 Tax=Sulfitobacter sp. F26204 TaxID=2996014 RepID=UPI00225E0462|nr:class I SAM-dependent methyltransferase [Sulfitobacter sp. F26204]MCX7561840.1 class I SAM-dependent methyltransferase [Sulfitobacter sp. F26204]
MKPLKRLERYVSALFTLGRVKGMSKDAYRGLQHLEARVDEVDQTLSAMQSSLDARQSHLEEADHRMHRLFQWTQRHEKLAEDLVADYRAESTILKRTGQSDSALLSRMFSDLSRRLDAGSNGQGVPKSTPPKTALPSTEGFELFKDSFYHRLENRYRGVPEEIAKRLKVYLPDVEAAWLRTGKLPAMDIGCGRGEWLGLLKGHGIDGFGIDTNAVQIEEAKEAGLDVRLGDALQALADQPDASLCVITAHHLIEHLPFDAVAWITREAGRVLAPGGLLLFETPNTRNVLVGATTFHTDPTHLKPMPEQVMSILFETAGFDPVDVHHLNPHERLAEFLDTPGFNDELAFLMFGPQDLAILGTRPIEA